MILTQRPRVSFGKLYIYWVGWDAYPSWTSVRWTCPRGIFTTTSLALSCIFIFPQIYLYLKSSLWKLVNLNRVDAAISLYNPLPGALTYHLYMYIGIYLHILYIRVCICISKHLYTCIDIRQKAKVVCVYSSGALKSYGDWGTETSDIYIYIYKS